MLSTPHSSHRRSQIVPRSSRAPERTHMWQASQTAIRFSSYDNYATTPDTWKLIAHLLPRGSVIWEAAYMEHSPGPDGLAALGMDVISDDIDFMTEEPERPYDCIVTNIPFSCKLLWLRRALELDKPFIFLMPSSTFGTIGFIRAFADDPKMQILLPRERLSFWKFSGGSPAPADEQYLCPFDTAFYCYGFGLPNKIGYCPDIPVQKDVVFKRHREKHRPKPKRIKT